MKQLMNTRLLLSLAFAIALSLLLTYTARSAGEAQAQTEDIAPAVKMAVPKSGMYRVGYGELANVGFPVDKVDPRNLQVHVGGEEIRVWVVGEEDGVFHPEDWLIFYGEALDTTYSGVNVYWLRVGTESGLRMTTRAAPPTGQWPPAHSFTETLHTEINSFYWQTMPAELGPDHWFWGTALTAPERRHYGLETPGAMGDQPMRLRVRLQAETSAASTPNHHLRVEVSSTSVGEAIWNGRTAVVVSGTVPGGAQAGEALTLTLDAMAQGEQISRVHLDWIEVDYKRGYTAENDVLVFGGPGAGRYAFNIRGFGGDDPALYDISDPHRPVRLTGFMTGTDAFGVHAHFADELADDSRLLALTSRRYEAPKLTQDTPSAWRSPGQGADYILLTHRDFAEVAAPLVSHRQSQGLQVALVDVEDIYDEFAFGRFDPPAIRRFLAYAWENWQPRPRYLLIVGDGNQDYRDYLGTGVANTVPAPLVYTAILGQTPSDNWYGAVDGVDPLPEISIGRLSAATVAQVSAMVTKLLAYETADPDGEWRRRALMIADSTSSDHETLSEKLIGLLPTGVYAQRIYASQVSESQLPTQIVDAWNEGGLLINYSGHGASRYWGGGAGRFFGPDEIAMMDNGSKLPIVLVANCLNGFFTDPVAEGSLAERLQRLPDGGAVAVFAPTGLFYPAGHEELFKALYAELFYGEASTIGEAMVRAKKRVYGQSAFWGELVETYTLFGDPAMRVRMPLLSHLYLPAVSREQ